MKELPRILGESKVDVGRYAVGGESAGGTNAAMLGHLASPSPLVVLNLYGLVDFLFPTPPTTATPSHAPSPVVPTGRSGLYTEAQIATALVNRDVSETITEALDDWVNDDPSDLRHALYGDNPRLIYGKRQKLRGDMFAYMFAHGLLRQTLFHFDDSEDEEALELFEQKKREMPALVLLENAATYPATYVYHGTSDTNVDIS
ncbi:hypothetical protein FRB93_010062 [Tulasnella sp. JGI-2019a]|nr:hypothetical protein FRB93_010062 [Tulasnella sp. JGI-2019a]